MLSNEHCQKRVSSGLIQAILQLEFIACILPEQRILRVLIDMQEMTKLTDLCF